MKQQAGSYWGGVIKALGLVFGDIGTSPIYTLTVIVSLTKPSQESIYGIISLIVWTLIILVSVEYAWLAMGLITDFLFIPVIDRQKDSIQFLRVTAVLEKRKGKWLVVSSHASVPVPGQAVKY